MNKRLFRISCLFVDINTEEELYEVLRLIS